MANEPIVVLLADLVLIAVVAWIFGRVARLCGQPAVIGEIVAGIALGPAVLGTGISAAVFPVEVHRPLEAFASIGIAAPMA